MKHLQEAAKWAVVAVIVAIPAVQALQTLSLWLEGAINAR